MNPIPFLKKLLVCFIAGLTAAIATQRIIFRIIWEFKDKWIPAPISAAIPVLLVLLLVIVYAVWWQRKEKKGAMNSSTIFSFWQGIIRYFIALDLSMIGWQKLFHLQFFTPLGKLDEPFSSFSGEALTWAYFGHSYAFTCVVGLIQIAGSYLLLFKRTTLPGCLLLFPVLLNIILIDFFYGFDAGELAHAVILMTGIAYLVLQEHDRLVKFFFSATGNLPLINSRSRLQKNIIRFCVLCIPLLLILSYGSPDKNPELTGKYSVQNLLINQRKTAISSCKDSVLTIVYFDQGNDIVFEFNSLQRRLIGSYEFDRQNNKLKAVWRYPSNQKDIFTGILLSKKQNQLILSGKIGPDSLQAVLLKTK